MILFCVLENKRDWFKDYFWWNRVFYNFKLFILHFPFFFDLFSRSLQNLISPALTYTYIWLFRSFIGLKRSKRNCLCECLHKQLLKMNEDQNDLRNISRIHPSRPQNTDRRKIRIISPFQGLPANVTSNLIKTNSCLTQSYPVICEVLQAELRPQIILTSLNKAVMLI